ncbi:hypothetical protein PUATCC27989T_03810 [Phytobacter ursingii]|nr:hypothetical protein PUATCC27989T_03810 [Phytobacter ursingii]
MQVCTPGATHLLLMYIMSPDLITAVIQEKS